MAASGKLVIILNGISRKKKKFYQQILPAIQEKFDVEVWETKHRDHGIVLGKNAALQNPTGVLAAGGDGTLNQVLNGIFKSGTEGTLPSIGIIPLGTGNDFARLNHIKPIAEEILDTLHRGAKATDVGRVICRNENGEITSRYFINVASLGMGPAVVRRLFNSSRALGPTLTYFKAITQTFFTHRPEAVQIQTDAWSWSGKLRVLAIANGQSFGSGLYVAPNAKPDDGLFSTFIAAEIPLLKFLVFLQRIKSTTKIQDRLIHYNSCKKLYLTAPEKCWIETEGELVGILPAEVEIIPGGIRFFR
jgi:YegS/Rv2252/BmrU family lipid kinase